MPETDPVFYIPVTEPFHKEVPTDVREVGAGFEHRAYDAIHIIALGMGAATAKCGCGYSAEGSWNPVVDAAGRHLRLSMERINNAKR